MSVSSSNTSPVPDTTVFPKQDESLTSTTAASTDTELNPNTDLPTATSSLETFPHLLTDDITRSYEPTRDTENLKLLLQKMNTLTNEIDIWAKTQQDLISTEALSLIKKVIEQNKQKNTDIQNALQQRTNELDQDFQQKRELLLAELEQSKQQQLNLLQNECTQLQAIVNKETKEQIDEIRNHAKEAKLHIVQEAEIRHTQLQETLASTSNLTKFDTIPITPRFDLKSNRSRSVSTDLSTISKEQHFTMESNNETEVITNSTSFERVNSGKRN